MHSAGIHPIGAESIVSRFSGDEGAIGRPYLRRAGFPSQGSPLRLEVRMKRSGLIALASALLLYGCAEQQPGPMESVALLDLSPSAAAARVDGGYVVLFDAEAVPTDFPERIAALGGRVHLTVDQIGV